MTAQPMTVGEVITFLKEHYEPSTMVYLNCTDEYYSGPLLEECFSMGTIYQIAPHDYEYIPHIGHPKRKSHYPGGWSTFGDNDHVVDSKPAVLIQVES